MPPWSTGGPEWEPGNGGLTERHIQASVGKHDGCGVGVGMWQASDFYVKIREEKAKVGEIWWVLLHFET